MAKITRSARPLVAAPRMGVMEGYASYARTGVSSEEHSGTPAPHGMSLGQIPANSVWSEIPSALGLPFVGKYTLWATRKGDLSWDARQSPPDVDLAVYELTDAAVAGAAEAAFGHPLPFVAILTDEPLTEARVEALWSNTAYEPHSTEALYRQDDARPVPMIYFLHWGLRMESADAPQRLRSLDARAQAALGTLVLGLQVPRTTTEREFPATPFDRALWTQLALAEPNVQGGGAEPVQAVVQQPVQAAALVPTRRALPWWAAPTALGVAVGLGAFFVRRK